MNPNANAKTAYKLALELARRNRPAERRRMLDLLQISARSGHAKASHALATWYLLKARKRDFEAAYRLELKAARSGIAEAAFNVAVSLETGRGVARDLSKAIRYYRRAADLGDSDALYELSRCYYYGIGTRRDRKSSDRWFRKALKAGVKSALEDSSGEALRPSREGPRRRRREGRR